MLTYSKPVKQSIMLGAEANQASDQPLLPHNVKAAQVGIPTRGKHSPREHVQGARLPSTIDAQETKALSKWQAEAQTFHSCLWCTLRCAVNFPQTCQPHNVIVCSSCGDSVCFCLDIFVHVVGLCASDDWVRKSPHCSQRGMCNIVNDDSEHEEAWSGHVQVQDVLAGHIPVEKIDITITSDEVDKHGVHTNLEQPMTQSKAREQSEDPHQGSIHILGAVND
mmetsp:Transcript_58428/g.136561  ORF Transcript_58428/g.136561 Transcript_58428/m.136561 type:complete len:222 (-) Transcript_58428:3824-4489(-)